MAGYRNQIIGNRRPFSDPAPGTTRPLTSRGYKPAALKG